MELPGKSEILGRDDELARVSVFVAGAESAARTLLIEGEAGVGKTMLWRAGIASAPAHATVLTSRPVQTEATLAFAGLGDLLSGVVSGELESLPEPQRRALETALQLRTGSRSDHLAVGAGTLSVLRALAARNPVLLAIDDLQWLDRSSARAVAFAFRRLGPEPVRLLGSVRAGTHPDATIELDDVEHVRLGPLSVGAIGHLLAERVPLVLPRTVLRNVHETAHGNPFFALELGRALAEADVLPGPGELLPVPGELHQLLSARVRKLSPKTRDALLAAALLAKPTEDVMTRASADGWNDAFEEGMRAGVVELAGGNVVFTHPLLASAVAASASADRRRAAHARLAVVVEDEEQRARHLALAATAPDEAMAACLEAAAELARRRGAPDAAAELAELARSLTPADRPHDKWRRTVAAGDARFAAGDTELAGALFTEASQLAAPGPEHAATLRHLARVRSHHDDVQGALTLLRVAREEAAGDIALLAAIEYDLSYPAIAAGRADLTLRHGQASASLAEKAGATDILAGALSHVAVAEFVLGRGVRRDLLERACALDDWNQPRSIALRPAMVSAHILSWAEHLDEARALLIDGERELRDRGDDTSLAWVGYRLAELDCWSGDWVRGSGRGLAAHELAVMTGQRAMVPMTSYAVALLAAHLGRVEHARACVKEGVAASGEVGHMIGAVMNLGVLGFLELSLGRPDRAHEILGPLVLAVRPGCQEPALMWWLADEIEALVALGDHAIAAELNIWLGEQAGVLNRPVGLATALRGKALLAAAEGRVDHALQSCEDALVLHGRAAMPFARARTLFTTGQIARRGRKWGAARQALNGAVAAFEGLGASLWLERSRDELARVGGRPVASPVLSGLSGMSGLSAGEQQIAELVASGRTNREVAEAMFLSPRTVSSSLSRIYTKLGVASRAEMASKFNK